MATRSIASRWGILKRSPFYSQRMQSRFSSGGSDRVLSEEERAAESMYIKKMENEKLEKLATQGATADKSISNGSAPESGTPAVASSQVKETSTDSNKNIATAAGVVALVASGWWYRRANKKVEEEEKE